MKKKVLQITMTEELYAEISELAHQEYRSRSAFGYLIFVEGLKVYKEKQEKEKR